MLLSFYTLVNYSSHEFLFQKNIFIFSCTESLFVEMQTPFEQSYSRQPAQIYFVKHEFVKTK